VTTPPGLGLQRPKPPAKRRRKAPRRRDIANVVMIFCVVLIQLTCTFFFVSDILSSMVGLPLQPISWRNRELIEIGAAGGLLLGLIIGTIVLYRTLRRTRDVESKLRAASGAFMELMSDRFEAWTLTPAEKDVALFSIKGLSTQEIARIRETSEGTVKSQTNAIYRKAGVTGRPQLLSLFIDDLMDEALLVRKPPDRPNAKPEGSAQKPGRTAKEPDRTAGRGTQVASGATTAP